MKYYLLTDDIQFEEIGITYWEIVDEEELNKRRNIIDLLSKWENIEDHPKFAASYFPTSRDSWVEIDTANMAYILENKKDLTKEEANTLKKCFDRYWDGFPIWETFMNDLTEFKNQLAEDYEDETFPEDLITLIKLYNGEVDMYIDSLLEDL